MKNLLLLILFLCLAHCGGSDELAEEAVKCKALEQYHLFILKELPCELKEKDPPCEIGLEKMKAFYENTVNLQIPTEDVKAVVKKSKREAAKTRVKNICNTADSDCQSKKWNFVYEKLQKLYKCNI